MDDATRDVADAGDLRVLSREELEAEVSRRTAELQNVMDTMADVLVTLDAEGRIEMANAAVEDILGYDPSAVEGRPFAFLLATADREGGLSSAISGAELVERLFTEGEVTDLEVPFETADGVEIPMKLSASVMREDGAVTGYVCVAKDITEIKRRERKLRRQNEYLDEFASVVSHDIATPLGIIENKAQLVELTGDQSHLDDIFEATERIQNLVDELLELARQGKQVDGTSPVDVADVTRSAWESVEGGEATLTVDSTATVEASRDRLRQLFENLLGNAVEHGSTDEDPAEIVVGALPDGFYVADDGPGIPEADREQVFEQGYTTGEDGTGLGLAIVRRIVDAHGWSVEATESAEGGARFEVRGVTRTESS